MTGALEGSGPDGIAVIGMSGRFPGAADLHEFWENLRDGVESISRFSRGELTEAGIHPAIVEHPAFVNAGGVLEGAECFDAPFFGFSAREAEVLDPQQRVFLECAWHALEDAGYDPQTHPGVIGVFGGAALSSYLFNIISNPEVMALVGSYQVLLGNDKDHLATHVSYKLDLRGPAVTVQTACSTSLVAVCMACQSLLDHQCDMALAGGVSIKVPQKAGYLYQEGMINSPDGHCRPFDAAASGTVGGNGVGLVVLKRLAEAVDDRDHVYAVIRGSAVNNDGSMKVGYTAPSVQGQSEVIAMAHAIAGVAPETISYVEAHGTATPLGDPVEVAALSQAFSARTEKRGFCGIGSVKANIGHLDPASGVAGLIKTVLMLEHKWLPPSLHCNTPNPRIDLADSPFYVNTTSRRWSEAETPRRAGVSSFGMGGTNAHVVLEEAPPTEAGSERQGHLIVLSARSPAALDNATANLAAHLKRNPEADLANVSYTLQVGRRRFEHRRTVVCADVEDAVAVLDTLDPSRVQTAVSSTTERQIVFLFPGQGAQHVNMARDLYEREPTVGHWIDYCADSLRNHLGVDLRSILYPSREPGAEDERRLGRTEFAQPALFVVEYALARLWMEWGVRPSAMIGHSIGEYVAACLAGVFSLDDALALVAARGRLMQSLPSGAMLAVPASESEVETLLGGELDLAAVNAPSQCVVSGGAEAIEALELRLGAAGIPCRRLQTSHAFHSRSMEAALAPFREVAAGVALNDPEIPFASNLTGGWVAAHEATSPDYWANHLRRTVRFGDGLGTALQLPQAALLEVGPGAVLGGLARAHPAGGDDLLVLRSLGRARASRSDAATMLDTLGRLWLAGAPVDWRGLHRHGRPRRVSLPAYPFERERYWIGPQGASAGAQSALAESPRPHAEEIPSRREVAEWFYRPVWRSEEASESPGAADPPASPRRWLVFGGASALSSRIVELLSASGQDVCLVEAAGGFAQHDARSFSVDPGRPSDYSALFGALQASGWSPERVVHLWTAHGSGPVEPSRASFERAQELGFYSLLFLAQALAGRNASSRVKIGVVTSSLHSIRNGDTVRPELATVSGLCKVIPQELPNVRCQTIDLVLPDDGAAATDDLVARVLAEIARDAGDTAIAYRSRERCVRRYERVHLDADPGGGSLLRRRGVYLITGGLGNIGLLLAEELAAAIQARLVLVGRSPLPARESWGEWLETHAEADGVSRKLRRIQALERAGETEVLVCSADVSDEEQMAQVIARARERFGAPNGVIHAAGVTSAEGFAYVDRTDRSLAERQFAAKAHGLLVLERLLRGSELDFWLLFSSLSTVLGGLGFGAYAAANSFLDAFAELRNSTGSTPWLCVDWDGWGFATDRNGVSGMSPGEGLEAFRRVVGAQRERHLVVSAEDLGTRIEQWIELDGQRGPRNDVSLRESHARPDLQTAYVAPRNSVEDGLAQIWQELLGVVPIGVHDSFFDLGGHSLSAIQLASRVRDVFRADVSLESLFDAPTIAALAAGLEAAGGSAAVDADRAARILELVEQLSDGEVEALLAEQGRRQ